MSVEKHLQNYANSQIYPMHMPGHKRNSDILSYSSAEKIDVTELDITDDLHNPQGIFIQTIEKAKRLYNSQNSFLLVNGSTCGILAGISACCPFGGKVLLARNCHKSVYNALYLRQAHGIYIYPQTDPVFGINTSIRPQQIKKMLEENKDVSLVVITSPTYEGVISDIKEISDICHEYGVPLLVDEAHGAHLGLSKHFPLSAVSYGADIVVQSLHKTLPALTQTALVHVNRNIVDKNKVHNFINIYESSSPSYVLSTSADKCFDIIENNGKNLFNIYANNLKEFYSSVSSLKNIKVFVKEKNKNNDFFDFDYGKILISVKNTNINGAELKEILRRKYLIELEMSYTNYALAMTSICDTKQGFTRLAKALLEIDCQITKSDSKESVLCLPKTEQIMPIYVAEEYNGEYLKIGDCLDKICKEYVYVYPPGVPLIAPGEKITAELIHYINKINQKGLSIICAGKTFNGHISVISNSTIR